MRGSCSLTCKNLCSAEGWLTFGLKRIFGPARYARWPRPFSLDTLGPRTMLYKYLAPERIDVLQKRRIRFTPPGAFNDPFEFRPVLKTLASDPEFQQFIDLEFTKLADTELAKIGPLLSLVPSRLLKNS